MPGSSSNRSPSRPAHNALLTLGLALIVSGCINTRPPDADPRYQVEGQQYGVTRGNFRGRWWNYYERGRSFLDGGFLVEAERDLRRAVQMRNIDARYAPTYGMHFIPYFGNREVGVTLFRQRRYEEALPFLRRSLQQEQTEKVEHFISLCEQALAAAAADVESPQLVLGDLPVLTSEPQLLVSAQLSDDRHIATISVNGKALPVRVKKSELQLRHAHQLVAGQNDIVLTVSDTSGNTTTASHRVVLDQRAPQISQRTLEAGALQLTVDDQSSFRLVTSDNATVAASDKEGVYTCNHQDRQRLAHIVFEDAAGNRNHLMLPPLPQQPTPAPAANKKKPTPKPAANKKEPPPEPAAATVAMPTPKQPPLKTIQEPGPSPAAKTLEDPFVIHLDHYIPRKVYQPSVVISGEISGRFRKFSIDGVQRQASGERVRFAFRQQLELGANTVRIDAESPAGSGGGMILNIERFPGPSKLRELRAMVMLTPLSQEGGNAPLKGADYSRLLRALHSSERFRMLERKHLGAAQQEHELVAAGWVDAKTAARLGKLAQADYTIACSVRPTQDDVEIYGRLIDSVTAEVLASCDVYEAGAEASDITNAYQRFVEKLVTAFPVLEQPIQRRDGRNLQLAIGKDAGVRKGMRFVTYSRQGGLVDPFTGQVILQGNVVVGDEFVVKKVKARQAVLKAGGAASDTTSQFVVSK